MAKKLMLFLLLFALIIFLGWGAAFVQKSGVLEPYPEEEYLTENEIQTRPFYDQLTQQEKAAYTTLYRGICDFEKKIALPSELDSDTFSKLYCLIEKQESDFFYIDSTFLTAEKIRDAQIIFRDENEQDYPAKAAQLERTEADILSGLPRNADDYQKALYIHDYIVKNCKYDVGEEGGYNATAYGCLVLGKAHCEGYAKSFNSLARKAGLKSVVVTGVTYDGENHAWNQVEINGKWYNMDVTWDDTDVELENRHYYFMCNDESFFKTHTPRGNYFEPFKCYDKQNYYSINELLVENLDDAERILQSMAVNNEIIKEIQFTDRDIYDTFKVEYLQNEEIFRVFVDNGSPILGENLVVTLRENERELCMTLILS